MFLYFIFIIIFFLFYYNIINIRIGYEYFNNQQPYCIQLNNLNDKINNNIINKINNISFKINKINNQLEKMKNSKKNK